MKATALMLAIALSSSSVVVAQSAQPAKTATPAAPRIDVLGTAPRNPLLATLLDQEMSLIQARARRDGSIYKQALAGDFIGVGTDGKTGNKEDVLEDLNDTTIDRFSIYNLEALALNETAAVLTYDAIVLAMVGDEAPPRYQHISSTWVKQGDKWLLKFQQTTTPVVGP